MRQMTELDTRLQEIASKNWAQFVALVGEDAINQAKICLLRSNKKSWGQIQQTLSITEKQARYGCGKCPTSEPAQQQAQA